MPGLPRFWSLRRKLRLRAGPALVLACSLFGQFAWAQITVTTGGVVVQTPNPETRSTIPPDTLPSTYGIGDTIEVDVTFSAAAFVREHEDGGFPQLELTFDDADIHKATFAGGSGTTTLTFQYIVQRGDRDTDGISIAAGGMTDEDGSFQGGTIEGSDGAAANRSFTAVAAQARHKVDGVTPKAETVEITSCPSALSASSVTVMCSSQTVDTYRVDDTIELEVTFSEVVYVTEGASDLTLLVNVGGQVRHAALVEGSGTATLTFAYVVQAGDLDTDGVNVGLDALVGGVIQDTAGNRVGVAHRRLTPLAPDRAHLVNGTLVIVDDVVPGALPAEPCPDEEDGTARCYSLGEEITVSIVFDKPVFVAGEAALTLLIGGVERRAELSSGSGTETLVFRYVVQAGDFDDDGISIAPNALVLPEGTTITDAAGRLVATDFLGRWFENYRVDTRTDEAAPNIEAVTISSLPAGGAGGYGDGETITIEVHFVQVVHVTGQVQLELSIGPETRYADYVSGSGTQVLTFEYVVALGDFDSDGISIRPGALLGGSIVDNAGSALDRRFQAVVAHRSQRVDASVGLPPAEVQVASAPAQRGAYGVGEFIDLHIVFPQPVFVRRGEDCQAEELPVLQLAISESSPHAELHAGSGTRTLWFRYKVQPGDFDDDGFSVSAGQDDAGFSLGEPNGSIGSLTGGCIEDADGREVSRRFRAIPPQTSHRVDGLAPEARTASVVSRPVGAQYGLGETIEINATFSEVVYVTNAADLALLLNVGSNTRRATYVEGSGTNTLSFAYVVERRDFDSDGIDIGPDALDGGTIQDVAGNLLQPEGRRRLQPLPAQAGHRVDAALDAAPPHIAAVTIVSAPVGAAYGGRESVTVQVRFNEIVHVSGAPQLAISIGSETRNAAFLSGSGTETLTFTYVVADGDFDGDGIAVSPGLQALVDGVIEDAAGNAADRYFEGLPANASHLVDARVAGVAVRDVRVVSAAQPIYRASDAIDVAVQFDGVVHVRGTPMLTLLVGGRERQAALLSGSGTRTLVFRYTVRVGDVDEDGISIGASALEQGAITDGNGREVATGFFAIPAQSQHWIDALAAEVTATVIGSDPGPDRTYRAGDRIEIQVSFTEPVLVIGDVALRLSIGAQTRSAPLLEGGGTDTLTFAYEVQVGDRSIGVSVPANAVVGGEITDLAGNDAVRSSPGLAADQRHRVLGAAPSVVSLRVLSDPGPDRTYAPGDTIAVAVRFDGVVHVGGAPLLTLLIGGDERQAELFDGSGTTTLVFRYVVQEGEYDGDGISINSLVEGTIADGAGNAAERGFVGQREPDHRVGAELLLVLPTVTVEVGSEAKVDVEAALEEVDVHFIGRFEPPMTEDAAIAEARVIGQTVTLVAVSEGITVISVAATGVPLTVAIPVLVEVSAAERAVIENGLAAFGRGLLASQADTVARRLEFARRGGSTPGYRMAAQRRGAGWNDGGRASLGGLPAIGPGMAGQSSIGAVHDGFDSMVDGVARHGHGHIRQAGGIPYGQMFATDLAASPFRTVSWGVWAAADSQSFKGSLGLGDYDGSMQSLHLGVDVRGQAWVAGASVSRANADVSYEFGTDGTGVMETQLNTVSPYVQWSPTERAVFWTVLGLGTGEAFALREGQDRSAPANLSSRLGLVGGRFEVGGAAGLELALRGDAGMVQLETDEGLRGIDGLAVDAQRFRAGVEASLPLALGSGELVPFVDLGGRWDGGDGATGGGAEVAGGLRYRGPLVGLELKGRSLVHHGTAGTEETGVAATLFIEPDAQGRGWRLSLSPRRGAAEWTDRFNRSSPVLAASPQRFSRPEWQWQGRVGYGFAMHHRRATLTPFGQVDTNGPSGRRTRLGIAYERAGDGLRGIRLEALSELAEGGDLARQEQRVLLTAEARF